MNHSDISKECDLGDSIQYVLIYGLLLGVGGTLKVLCKRLPLKLYVTVTAITIMAVIQITDSDLLNVLRIDESFAIPPKLILIYYVPATVAIVSFQINHHQLRKIYLFGCFTSIALMALNVIIIGILLKNVMDAKWSTMETFIFGVSLCGIQHGALNYRMKNEDWVILNDLLQAECVCSMVLSLTIIDCYAYSLNTEANWSQFLIVLAKQVTLGMIIGYLLGWMVIFTMPIAEDDPKTCFIVLFGSMCGAYYIATLLPASPSVMVLVMTNPLHRYEQYFSGESNSVIEEMFQVTGMLGDLLISIYCIYFYAFVAIHNPNLHLRDNFLGFICIAIIRCFVYVLVAPPIKYAFKTKSLAMVIMGAWTGITSNATYIIGLMLFWDKRTFHLASVMIPLVLMSTLCTNLVNCIALRFLFRSNYFTVNRTKIDALTQYVTALSNKYLGLWKNRAITSDVHWDAIHTVTSLMGGLKNYRGTQNSQQTQRNVTCPDCGRNIQVQNNVSDSLEAVSIARERLKYQLRTVLLRQRQAGNLSKTATKGAIKVVQGLTFEGHTHIESFKPCLKKMMFEERVFSWYHKIFNSQSNKLHLIPRKRHRALCHRIVQSAIFAYLMYACRCLSSVMLVGFLFIRSWYSMGCHALLCLSILCLPLMVLEMYCFINAYSFILLSSGTRAYFKSIWHCMEMLCLCLGMVDNVLLCILYAIDDWKTWQTYKYIRLVRIIELVHVGRSFLPKFMDFFQQLADTRLGLAYEQVKAVHEAYSEVDAIVRDLYVQNHALSREFAKWVTSDKLELQQILTHMQLYYPGIVFNVHTKQLMRTVLVSMTKRVDGLRSCALVDEEEYQYLRKRLRACDCMRKSIRAVKNRSFKQVLFHVPWISASSDLIKDYLLHVATVENLDKGAVVCSQGDLLEATYVVVSGCLKLIYKPVQESRDRVKHGLIPILNCVQTINLLEQRCDLLVSGASFGEMCHMTNRPFCATVGALTPTKLLCIRNEHLESAESFNKGENEGILLSHMWKAVCFSMVVALLKADSKYDSFTVGDISAKVAHSVVPDVVKYETFHFLDAIDDLVLLDGTAVDLHNGKEYIAPAVIPRSVIKLKLHTSTYMDSGVQRLVSTKLLITLMDHANLSEIMKKQSNITDFIPEHQCTPPQMDRIGSWKSQNANLIGLKDITTETYLSKFMRHEEQ